MKKDELDKLNRILNNIKIRSKNEERPEFKDLYNLLSDEVFGKWALGKLIKNKGINTPGTDGKKVEGYRTEEIKEVCRKLKEEEYEPKPVRRIYIPKPGTDKRRPLGIPSLEDKIVQQMILEILESIYEPYFATQGDLNFGFRRGKSPGEAINRIKWRAQKMDWCIEGDIKGAYENVSHSILMEILSERIRDKKMLKLINKFLKAGIMEENKYSETLIGTPQGGIISPILFNVYMSKLDEYVKKEEERLNVRNREEGKRPQRNKEYDRIQNKIQKTTQWLRKKEKELGEDYNKWNEEDRKKGIEKSLMIRELTKERSQTDSQVKELLPLRTCYVRYADDWVIFTNGDKERATDLRERIDKFLSNDLRLTLNREKTRITNIRENHVNFLGFGMIMPTANRIGHRKGKLGTRRISNHQLRIGIDEERIKNRIISRGFAVRKDGKIKLISKAAWTVRRNEEIIDKYNMTIRGLVSYWSQGVDCYTRFNKVVEWLRWSCYLTIAHKKRTTGVQIKKKYGNELEIMTSEGKKIRLTDRVTLRKMMDKIKMGKGNKEILDGPLTHTNWRTIKRLSKECRICGATKDLEIHHVNKLKNLRKKPEGFTKIMIKMNRKQIAVCKPCHKKIHQGKYDGIGLSLIEQEEQ